MRLGRRVRPPSSGGIDRLPPVTAFVWETYGPYHVDRCEALHLGLADQRSVLGVEISSSQDEYEWDSTEGEGSFRRITLFPRTLLSDTRLLQRLIRLTRTLTSQRPQEVFFCNYEKPEIFLCAIWMRLRGARAFSMQNSKFDDRPRHLGLEFLKTLLLAPYDGSLASGPRARDYARFLGFRRRPVVLGYNSLSIDRVRANAQAEPAPGGLPFDERHFIAIARFVPKKNLFTLLDAYRLYRQQVVDPRQLIVCGSGELQAALIEKARVEGINGIRWEGFLQEKGIAQRLAESLALVLPSSEEQWGNVVNEALAMGVPVICSTAVGACDLLVRTTVNGYVVEPDNAFGFAAFMTQLHREPDTWHRLASNAIAFSVEGDVHRFVEATRELIGLPVNPDPTDSGQPSPSAILGSHGADPLSNREPLR